jgi:ribonuclease P protein component
VSGEFLTLHLLRTRLASSRLGLAVPRAVGNAVVRNRLKRRLRELFRTRLRRELDERPGPCDLVIRARPGAGARSQAELLAEIAESLERWRRKPRGRAKRKDRTPS